TSEDAAQSFAAELKLAHTGEVVRHSDGRGREGDVVERPRGDAVRILDETVRAGEVRKTGTEVLLASAGPNRVVGNGGVAGRVSELGDRLLLEGVLEARPRTLDRSGEGREVARSSGWAGSARGVVL